MDWEDARIFLAVAREGQLLGAARRLGLNQTTLSRRLSRLEGDLKTTLLIRGPQGSSLTDEGQALAARLERAEAAMEEGEALFRGRAAQISGTVRIGAPDGFGVEFLAPRLGKLTDRHPGLTVELVPVPRAFSLSSREADVAILVGRPAAGRAVVARLTDYSLGLYAAHSYLRDNGMPSSVADLERHRLIGYVEDLVAAPGLDYVSEAFGQHRPAIAIATALGQMQATRSGAGIGVLHDYIVGDDPGLVPVLPELHLTRAYWLAYHESQRGLPKVQAVVEFIRSAVAGERRWIRRL